MRRNQSPIVALQLSTYTLQPYTLLPYYSYTLYDPLGRITEVGQKYQTTAMTAAISRDTAALAGWIYYNDGSNHYPAEMVTQTVYDIPGVDATACPTALRFVQKSYTLRNRVSYTRYYEKPSYYYDAGAARYYISGATYTTGIDYSYDIHGNVDSMRNLYNAITYSPITYHGYNSCKTIAYTYDLISGKVNEVHYNPGENDEFYHRYQYDAENRLTDVYTTDTKAFIGQPGLEEHDAKYQYYQHGPLARMQVGQQIVQGVDYAYTLQGWLKGINSTALSGNYDMGADGAGANVYNAPDGYGYTLYYFNGDYGAINYNQRPFAEPESYFPSGEYRPLYNGNISSAAHEIPARFYTQLYNYSYDQLNRLKAMDMYRGLNSTTNQWSSLTMSDLYKERYSYDANGNITHVFRNGNLSANPLMDSLSYSYKTGTNQLDYIRDKNSGSAAHSNNYGAIVDIKDQASGNYAYNAKGELNYDRISGIDSVKWNVYGKMEHIYKHSATYGSAASGLHYYYDPSGNRTGMAVLYNPSTYNAYTWYVRDAQGNVMAVYKANGSDLSTIAFKLREHYIYGSGRLGVINRDMDVDQPRLAPDNGNANLGTAYLATFTRGDKLFEFTNHLGNVLFTAIDAKVPKAKTGNPSLVGSYSVSMVTAVDYTPFGMIMQGMNYGSAAPGKYRYGFNGKEWENSTKGNADQIDYGERMYDNRGGRFLSVDKLTSQYPYYTPYQFAGNSPVLNIDLDGKEPIGNLVDMNAATRDSYYNLLGPKRGEEEYKLYRKGQLYGFVTGLGLVADYFLKGKITETLLASQGAGLFEHNRATTPEGQAKQKERFREGAADLSMNLAGGAVAQKALQSASILLSEGRRLYDFGARALGEMGEEALSRLYNTVKPSGKGSSIRTSIGLRKPDGIPLGQTVSNTKNLFESKVGFTEYRGRIVDEVAKDAELLSSGKVDEITWVFFRSPATGKSGASNELLQELNKAGIKTQIAGDIPEDIVNKAIIKYGATPKR